MELSSRQQETKYLTFGTSYEGMTLAPGQDKRRWSGRGGEGGCRGDALKFSRLIAADKVCSLLIIFGYNSGSSENFLVRTES